MRWRKLGLVYGPDGGQAWAQSHAMLPTPFRLTADVIRVYITCCDADGIGRPGFVDVLASDPTRVVDVSSRPLLEIGQPGAFDENGVAVCSVVEPRPGLLHMYYVGFELGTKIRYRLLTGLAVSNDGGTSFERYSRSPVLERSDAELYFRCGPCCLWERGRFRMWYVAGSEWTQVSGKAMPVYDIRYVESDDGIRWPAQGEVHMSISDADEHGFGRPYVIARPGGGYRMFYSVRRRSLHAYRLGYAESADGHVWQRSDAALGLDVSPGSFDSDAIMYAAPIEVGDRLLVFYNGNKFGRQGFAVAVLEG